MKIIVTFLNVSICGIFLAACASKADPPSFSGNAGSTGSTTSGASGSGSGGDTSSTTTSGAGGGAVVPVDTASKVVLDGFVAAPPWAGSGFTATEGGTVTPDCSSGTACTPAFAGTNFCMQGTVTGKADYSGFAMLGWNVNQPVGEMPATWAIPATGGLTVTIASDPATVAMRVQLQGTDPHSAADRWCAPVVSGKPIAWTDFKTNCWTGGTPQTPLAAGTMIQQAAITVPGLVTDLPFKNICLIDIQMQ